MTEPLTLKAFFCGEPMKAVLETCDPAAAVTALEGAAKRVRKETWPGLLNSYTELTDGFFDIRLEDLLLDGWQKISDFTRCVKESRENPQEACRCHLYDHDLKATTEPRIEVLAGRHVVAKIPFEVTFSATLRAIVLELRRGKIVAVCAGSLEGQAELAVKGRTLIRRTTPALQLPGRLEFSSPGGGPSDGRERVAA